MAWQFYLACTLSAIVYLAVGWGERARARTPAGFFQAGRNIGGVVLSGTYVATSLALANAIFYFLWLGYTAGLVGLWIQVAWCLGFVVLYLMLPKLVRESGVRTLHEFIGAQFGTATAIIAALISFVGISLNFGYEVVVGSTIIQALYPESMLAVGLFGITVVIVVVVYCLLGGFAAVVRTDTVQWILGALALIAAVLVLRNDIETQQGLASFHQANANGFELFSADGLVAMGGWLAMASFVVASLPWQYVDMTSWQKLSACNPKRLIGIRGGIAFSGLLILFIPGVFTLMLGVYLRAYADDSTPLLGALLNAVTSNPVVGVLILLGFLAAMISTADTYLIGSVQALVLDILHPRRLKVGSVEIRDVAAADSAVVQAAGPSAGPLDAPDLRAIVATDRDVRFAKLWIAPVAIIACTAVWGYWWWEGYDGDALFTIIYIVYSMQLSLTWVVLAGLFSLRRLFTPMAGVLSITTGVAANIILLSLTIAEIWPNAITAMPLVNIGASLVGFLIGSRIGIATKE